MLIYFAAPMGHFADAGHVEIRLTHLGRSRYSSISVDAETPSFALKWPPSRSSRIRSVATGGNWQQIYTSET